MSADDDAIHDATIRGMAQSEAEGFGTPHPHHPKLTLDVSHALARAMNAGMPAAEAAGAIVGLGLGVLSAMGAERDELARIVDDCVAALEAERKRQGGTPTD